MRRFAYSHAHRYIQRNIAIAAVASVSGLTLPALAEQKPASEVFSIGEVLVAEKYIEQDVGTSYQLTQDDFERINARSLDEALREIPSINVRNGADGTPRLDIRGLRTRQIKLLVNGIPFNSADDGQFDPTLIPTFAIGRIQLQAGASSVLYGDGGMGGVLDIQTRGGFQGLKVGGRAEFGSDHYWQTNAFAGYGDGTNDMFIAAGVRARDAFPMSDDFDSAIPSTRQNFQDDDQRNNSDYRRSNLIASFNRQVTDALRLGVFLSRVEGRYGKPPSTLDCRSNQVSWNCPAGAGGDPFAGATRYERTDDQEGTTVQLGADYDFSANWSGRLWFFSNTLKEELTGYDDADYDSIIRRGAYTEDDETRIRGAHAQLNGVIESTGTLLGLAFDRRTESFESSGVSCDLASSNPTRNQSCVISGGFTTPSNTLNRRFNYTPIAVDRDIYVTSLAGEITQPLPNDFSIVVGLGHHKLDKDGGSDDSEESAQIGLSKKLFGTSTAYATLARKVDAPTIRQLYDASAGNETLDFQRADHTEIGLKNRWARASLDIAVYQSRIKDFIERDDVTNDFENRQKLLFRGVDMTGLYSPMDNLTLNAAVGLLHARDESSDRDSSTLQYRPRHKMNLGAEYKFLGNYILSGQYQRIGGQAYFNRSDATDYRNLDSYELVFAKLSYLLPNDKGSLYVGVDNLLDEEYETSYGFPQAGRLAYMGLQVTW